VLAGFISYHLIEKETYLHHEKRGLVKLLSIEENVFAFSYHIILGIILLIFTRQGAVRGITFFIPVVLFTLASTLPQVPHQSRIRAAFFSSGTLLGVLVTIPLLPLHHTIESALIGFVVGVLLFTVTRHHIPFGRHGRPSYFLLGFIMYSLLLMSSWYL
jgi:hypothetical protein